MQSRSPDETWRLRLFLQERAHRGHLAGPPGLPHLASCGLLSLLGTQLLPSEAGRAANWRLSLPFPLCLHSFWEVVQAFPGPRIYPPAVGAPSPITSSPPCPHLCTVAPLHGALSWLSLAPHMGMSQCLENIMKNALFWEKCLPCQRELIFTLSHAVIRVYELGQFQ